MHICHEINQRNGAPGASCMRTPITSEDAGRLADDNMAEQK
jgi:hypothetical protein